MIRDTPAEVAPAVAAARGRVTPGVGPIAGGAAAGAGTPARVRVAVAGIAAAVLGAAPHVLHHVGPLAGAALVAGASGRVLFGVAGFVAAVPMLRRIRRRTGSWRVPAGVLGVMTGVFLLSSFVLGPAITGGDDGDRAKEAPARTVPAPDGHDEHH